MALNSLCDGRFLFNLYRLYNKGIVSLSGGGGSAHLVLSVRTSGVKP